MKIRITIDLPPEQIDQIKKLIAETGKSRNQIIFEALSEYMKKGH